MILPTCIDPDHNQIVSHNGRKLEITLALVTGMVDRNAASSAKLHDFIICNWIIGSCNNQKGLIQVFLLKNTALPDQTPCSCKLLSRNASALPGRFSTLILFLRQFIAFSLAICNFFILSQRKIQ